MRTTVEIGDELRARLLELAARRKEKGFSGIVCEAIEHYLETLDRAAESRRKAIKLRGAISRREAERLRAETERIRGTWR